MADTFQTQISQTNKLWSTTGTGYGPTDNRAGTFMWYGSHYTNLSSVRIQVSARTSGSCTPNGEQAVLFRLYNIDDAAAVAGSTTTSTFNAGSWYFRRSADFSANMPTTDKLMRIEVAYTCADSVSWDLGSLNIAQTTSANTKTMVFIPIGSSTTFLSTSYSEDSSINGVRKYWVYDADLFSNIDEMYFGATVKTASGTGSFRLEDKTSTDPVGEITTTSTSFEWKVSSDFKATMNDNDTYTKEGKVSGSFITSSMANAYVILRLDTLTKYQTILEIMATGEVNNGVTSWAANPGNFFGWYLGTEFFDGITYALTHQSTMSVSTFTNIQTSLYDEGARVTDSNLTHTSSTYGIQTDTAFTEPATPSAVQMGHIVTGSGGRGAQGRVGHNWVLTDVTDVTIEEDDIRLLASLGVGT